MLGRFKGLLTLFGIDDDTTSHGEKLISGLGALLGMLGIYAVSQLVNGDHLPVTLVASVGASAVLLFAVPLGALSQPWALLGGHLVSAFVGVSCQQLWPGELWTAPVAVAVAITSMHYLRCMHPPGGATALIAVIGGPDIHDLGYHYLLTPIGLNVLVIGVIAVLVNAPFPWRRYPAHLARREYPMAPVVPSEPSGDLSHEDFAAALAQRNSLMDVSSEDLAELFALAHQHAEKHAGHPQQIIAGHFYSNGLSGKRWRICQVIDAAEHPNPARDKVIFKVVAGNDTYETGICRRDEFRHWARFEVVQDRGRWVPVGT